MEIFAWRKRKRSLKENKLSISGIATDSVCCTSSRALEKEFADTCTPTDYNNLNIHAMMQAHAAMLEAERKKAEALIGIQSRHFVR